MKKYNCKKCDEEIYFDSNRKSVSGKAIPLDPITEEPHDCPGSTYKPRKTIGDEIMELDERESERIRNLKYE